MRSGEIPESRIDQSVLKILRAKASVGLNKARLVDIEAVPHLVAQTRSQDLAQEIADESVTLVRDNHRVLPLQAVGTNPSPNAYLSTAENRDPTLLLVFTPDVRTDAGWVFDRQMRARIPGTKTIYIDPRNSAAWAQPVMEAVAQAKTVVAAVYLNPQGGVQRNMVALSNEPEGVLQKVVQSAAQKTVVVSLGNPYFAVQMPEVQNYLCTFSDAKVSELSAVAAMFGEIPTPGRLPVTIPGIAPRGAGLSMSGGGTR